MASIATTTTSTASNKADGAKMATKASKTTAKACKKTGGSKLPPGVPHPEAGHSLGLYSQRCECGGITGINGTSNGSQKWRKHIRTKKHMEWMAIGM